MSSITDDPYICTAIKMIEHCDNAVRQSASKSIDSLEPFKNMIQEQVFYSILHDEDLVNKLYSIAEESAKEFIELNEIPDEVANDLLSNTLPEHRYSFAKSVAQYVWFVLPRNR